MKLMRGDRDVTPNGKKSALVDPSSIVGTRWHARIKAKYVPAGDYVVEVVGLYHDRSPALEIRHIDDHSVAARASVYLSGTGRPVPPPFHTYIKTWSENVGILEELVAKEIVEPVGDPIKVGPLDAKAQLVRLLMPQETIR